MLMCSLLLVVQLTQVCMCAGILSLVIPRYLDYIIIPVLSLNLLEHAINYYNMIVLV